MANKVDISEITDLSNDLQEASADFRSQLDKVQESIEAINGMGSFSGKAAKEAKQYFGELHITILESFKGLFDDLEANLEQHMEVFRSGVDVSESAVIKSTYLQDVQEDINEVFDDLEKQDEIIHDTIQEVSDISSASPPSFSDVAEYKKKTIKKLKEVDEDLASFNNKGDETDVKAIMSQIETAMSNAKVSEGKARFADFEGASQGSVLAELKGYNQDKKEEVMEKAKDARDSVLQNQNKPSSRDVVNKAYQEFKDGDITYDQYTAMLGSVKNTSGNMSEEKIKENTTDSFIEYLEDRGMLEDYLEDHEIVAKQVMLKKEEEQIAEMDPELQEIAEKAKADHENGDLDKTTYESLLSGLIHGGGAFATNLVKSKFSDEISKATATSLTNWWKNNTTHFVDRGLTFSFASGSDIALRETPSKLASALRTGAQYSPKFIGAGLDFGAQVLTGEDVGDAAIKTGGHLLGAAAGAGLVTLAVAAAPFTVAGIVATGAGFAAATLGSMAFDWVYDNGLKEGIDKVGDAVSGFVGKLGSVFS
ncbi:T7SS effector LXG polymorphic toxin [Virgibacillus sp. CBA3643]|uniref:T7SS effector LXG polymorphic toxin n=1 Tax=Virgibacillus sp. CBA3643 TaxID=2942278 RepID=UPI0035A2DF41